MPASSPRPELLAPAGTMSTFASAVEAGADAVYIGAPRLNARNLARHFSEAEIAAMIDHGRRNGVKVYLAMNSLMKEDELPQVVQLLAVLEQLGPDALIIQDLGLYRLVRRYFPGLKIHASTLLGAHNSMAVRPFAEMGFSRVVLAREMTLAEIAEAHRTNPVELEVFVHGALCFSYSGLCLFSSYCGGKSGLRGRCVQPCRRRYTWAGSGKGARSGYFFSMNDLDALELVPQIVQAGVSSLKIEGRMRSSRYVSSVVQAYRLIIDHGVSPDNVARARKILDQAMGRKGCGGYFLKGRPDDIISAHHSGNIGIFLGKLHLIRGNWAELTVKEPIQCGDRLRIHNESSGDRQSLTLKEIKIKGKNSKNAGPGETITIDLSGCPARPGDAIYKVDVKTLRLEKENSINSGRFNKKIGKLVKAADPGKIISELGPGLKPSGPQKIIRPGQKKIPDRKSANKTMPIWLKTCDPAMISQMAAWKPDKIILPLDHGSFSGFQKMKKNRIWPRLLVWGLPPVIMENEMDFYQKAIPQLLNDGFRNWQISHLGQLQFFPDRRRIVLSGDHTLNVLNSQGLKLLREAGLSRAMAAVENDQTNLEHICANKQGMKVGFMVYGQPPLFTSRLDCGHFHYGRIFASPKGEKFILRRRQGLTLALALQPFSLLPRLGEVAAAGIDYGVVDLSGERLKKRELEAVFRQIGDEGKKAKKLSTFNFFGRLS